MGRSEPFAPAPPPIQFFKNPREIDENACPPLAERIGGGAGAEGAAYSRARESQHEIESYNPVQSHHARGARD